MATKCPCGRCECKGGEWEGRFKAGPLIMRGRLECAHCDAILLPGGETEARGIGYCGAIQRVFDENSVPPKPGHEDTCAQYRKNVVCVTCHEIVASALGLTEVEADAALRAARKTKPTDPDAGDAGANECETCRDSPFPRKVPDVSTLEAAIGMKWKPCPDCAGRSEG